MTNHACNINRFLML